MTLKYKAAAQSFLWAAFFLSTILPPAFASEHAAGYWSGYISGQARGFWQSPKFDDQRDGDLSFAAEPEYYKDWNNGLRAITFKPFVRLDSTDPERSHVDIRSAHYLHVVGDWEWRVGIAKVFW